MGILKRDMSHDQIKTVHGSMSITSKYTAGIAGEEFFQKLKNGVIMGSHCSQCKKSFLPARLFCERCFSRLKTEKVVPEEGTLTTFTEVHLDLDGKQLAKSIFVGFVTFSGFHGGLIHKIHPNGKKLKIGVKVKPVFVPPQNRKGSILDLSHFTLV